MDAAWGKYIQILEADDAMGADMLFTLAETAEKYQTEITKADYYHFTGDWREGKKEYQNALEREIHQRCVYPAPHWQGISPAVCVAHAGGIPGS